MKNIYGLVRKAVQQWNMIEDGDKIAIGVSGGKDSLVLLETLSSLSQHYPKKFSIFAISIDMFDGKTDFSKIKNFCENLGIEFHLLPTKLYELLFEIRKEKNPCSLCAKMRRGMLCNKATELGCNKLALGHHADDLIETFFLSLFYQGRLSTFSPVTYLSRSEITVIRPLLLVGEKDIIKHAKNFPIIENTCPADKRTKREFIKNNLQTLGLKIPTVHNSIFNAILSPNGYHLLTENNEDKV